MGSYLSRDIGSCASISEIFAFPYTTANRYHHKTLLSQYKDIFFYKYTNSCTDRAIIFCHGNAMTVCDRTIALMNAFAEHTNSTLYMLEYPGYGESYSTGFPGAHSCI